MVVGIIFLFIGITVAPSINAELKDIALVFIEGVPLYGDDEFENIFKDFNIEYSKIKIEGKNKLIIGDPKGLMEKVRKNVGFNKELPFLPI